MKRPQFGERQYEIAANIELARGGSSPFVPTQNLEYYVGFDAAHDPEKAHAIWRILSVHVPKRVLMAPQLWPWLPRRFHEEIHGRFVSLFVQYKVATFQDHFGAKYRQDIGGAYFQVSLTPHQQNRLTNLEEVVRARAIVRYAAPAFWSLQEFGDYDAKREVLRRSAFASPADVQTHRRWMYRDESGPAFFNPEFTRRDGETWQNVLRILSTRAQAESLREHIRALSSALGADIVPSQRRGEVRWVDRIRRYGEFSPLDIELLVHISRISLAANAHETSWLILMLPEEPSKHLFDEGRALRRWFWEPYLW